MKSTRKQCREIAETITNEELQQMFESAKNNITNWSRPSDVNKGMTKGSSWNILAKDFNINCKYPGVMKLAMVREFGDYIPANLKPYKDFKKPEKKEKQIKHEEPIFEDNSDNNESYYLECMKLLNILLYIIHGPVCEICCNEFENETFLMPSHIISRGSMKRLQFKLENIVWICNPCHKNYDEGTVVEKMKIIDKMRIIKGRLDLIDSLKILYNETPLLKNQNVKENLNMLIRKAKLI